MKKINENLLIERYLQGTLSKEEEEAFEEAILSSPEVLDQVEAAERLGQGMKDLGAVEGLEVPSSGNGAVVSLFHSPRYALAATVFLAVSLVFTGSLYQRNIELAGLTASGTAAQAQIVPLHTVRSATGGEPFNIVEPGEPGSSLVLMLDPGFEPYAHYRATLVRLAEGQEPEFIVRLNDMQPGYEDMLALGLPSDSLAPGDYEVRVEGWRDDPTAGQDFEPVSRYTFRVP